MISIDGRYYFINFENVDKVLSSGVGASDEKEFEESSTEITKGEDGKVLNEKTITNKVVRPRELSAFRYQVISAMLDELLHGSEATEEDDTLPKKELDKLPLGMKLSFNTLLEYGIIDFIDIN